MSHCPLAHTAAERRLDQITDFFTDDEAGLKSKSELAARTGIASDVESDGTIYAAGNDSTQPNEPKDNVAAELDLGSEEVMKLFKEHQRKVQQALIKVSYLLEHPGQEGFASFLG